MKRLIFLLAVAWFGFLQMSFSPAKEPEEQAASYKQYCRRCHGDTGHGDGPAVKLLKVKPHDFTDKEFMAKLSEEDLYQIISKGGAALGKSTIMPAYEGKLKKDEIRELVSYVRFLAEQ